MTDGEELVLERRGPVLVARLNRPGARNALTPSLIAALGAAVGDAESDPGVRAVVLTGTGSRAFCAGLDLRALAAGGRVELEAGDTSAVFMRLLHGEVAIPVVGAVNGAAVAGGFELLLGCDLVVAAAGVDLGLPEVKRGLFPGGGGTLLATRIPLSVALEMTLTGDPVSAERGYELGLVNAVVPAEEVVPTACRFAARIAANGPLGVQACKELVRVAVSASARTDARRRHWQGVVFGSEDAAEGARAFVEKREPVFHGR